MPESEQKPPDEQDYNTPSLPYVPHQPELDEQQDQPVDLQSSATEASPAQEMPANSEPAHQPAIEQPPAQNSERTKRRRRLLLGAAVCILALPFVIFGIWGYLNRSTPMKTLDVFCQALQREDYHTAYSQFTPKLQSQMVAAQMNEKTFAALLKQDKIVSCTHGDAGEGGSNAMTSLKLVHLSQNVNNDIVTLVKDASHNWKIDLLQVAPQQ